MGLFDKLRGELIDIIEWNEATDSTLLAYRFPRYNNEIKYGAKLVVREGQAAAIASQRAADNIKTSVATDAFGNVADSNLGNLLVKLGSIRELVAKDSGDHEVVLHDGTVLRLSRSYKDALYDALNARE